MDNLVLIRVASALDRLVAGSTLVGFREEPPERFRLVFESPARRSSVVVSLDPVDPWIGRSAGASRGGRRTSGPFAARVSRALVGARASGLRKLGPDRVVLLDLGAGGRLVFELATHGANLVLTDDDGRVVLTARHPRSARARLLAGEAYRPPAIPSGKLVPFGVPAEEIDALLSRALAQGEEPLETLRRRVFGIGTVGAELVLDEAAATGRRPGEVLAARIAEIELGSADPWLAGPGELLEAALRGNLEPGSIRLLPWHPGPSWQGAPLVQGEDAAATAGLFHEALELSRWIEARNAGLRSILTSERRRIWDAERRVASELESFADPDRFRRWGEAILAGLSVARRVGEHAWVPDPYDAEGREIAIPVAAGVTLQAAARGHFERCRKARRGLETARRRRESLRERLVRLDRISADAEVARGEQDADRIEEAMRNEGIPVGLPRATRAGREEGRTRKPRLEAVRMMTSSDGMSILVGKSGRDNDRLTFRIAGPEDFWLHAAGLPGAHVVIRNPGRAPRPPRATLEEAATLAAWFSDARRQAQADVVWTRRKNVRRVRGAAPGTVSLKRFETLRVRPAIPSGLDAEPR